MNIRNRRTPLFSATASCLTLAVLLVATPLFAETPGPALGRGPGTITVFARTQAEFQAGINRLPPAGGKVIVKTNGPVVVSKSIVIDRDNVTLEGEGRGLTVLRLANQVNVPVIVMGMAAAAPTVTRRNIRITDLTIDGNQSNQSQETDPHNPALRNNGISIRRIGSSSVERVTIKSCRSGGLVTELGCRWLTIRDVESSDNYFDGMAGYATEDSLFSGLRLHNNNAAGLSIDLDFSHNTITESVFTDNGKLGIFMRDSRDNLFSGLQIRRSGEHGIFIAEAEGGPGTAATGNTFSNCLIQDSVGAGIRVNDASCVDNLFSSSQLAGNAGGGVSEAVPGLVQQVGVIVR